MFHFNHLKVVYILCACAVILVVSYALGAFDKSINPFESDVIRDKSPITNQNVQTDIISSDEQVNVRCTVNASSKGNYCGVTMWTNEKPNIGWDLSSYDSMEVHFSTNSLREMQKVKLTLKNFNPAYSVLGDVVSQKYNSVEIAIDSPTSVHFIPLEFFQVETWWMNQYNVQFELAQPDISNVHAIEFLDSGVSQVGTYDLSIDKIVFHGEYISHTQLMGINMVLMLFAIMLLIDRQRENQRQLTFVDPLTKLNNRRGLQEWVGLRGFSEKSLKKVSLLYMDIDDFKQVNDKYGHHVGDALLIQFCKTLKAVRKTHNISKSLSNFTRLSGDEFAFMIMHCEAQEAEDFAKALIAELHRPFSLNEHQIKVNVSIGIASEILQSSDTQSLFQKADAAMYFAKQQGKNQLKIFDLEVEASQMNRKRKAAALEQEIENSALVLKFIPIYNASTRTVSRVEIAVFSLHELLQDEPSHELMKLARDFKLIEAYDDFVLSKSLELLSLHKPALLPLNISFHIKVTALELQDSSYADYVQALLEQYEVPPSWLTIEVNELIIGSDIKRNIKTLTALKEQDITLTLDEFGVGNTPISQLVYYPIGMIKIDKSFVKHLSEKNEKGKLVVESIVSLARTCNLDVIAQGVSNLEQFYCLQALNCEMIQGPLFCEPLDIEELLKSLNNQKIMTSDQVEAITESAKTLV